jgi:hypothetical protein
MPRQPMAGLGMETHMESQTPLEPFWEETPDDAPGSLDMEAVGRRAYEADRRHREVGKYQRLVDDLAGNGGAVLKHTAMLLAQRIQTLIEADPEAKAYLQVLQQTAGALAIGKRYAERELAALFEEDVSLEEDPLIP